MKRIMIVEDDIFMREELVSMLQKENYEVLCIESFINTTKEILKENPDLVVLDLNLPVQSGFEICKEIKKKSGIPILILTSHDQLKDEINALNLGADEYITKPCNKDRLIARIVNILKRFENRSDIIEIEGIKLDLKTNAIYIENKSIILPENQAKIMELLLLNINEIVTKEMFYKKIWGTIEYIDENALQVNMTRLKKNLTKLNLENKILNVRGEGYLFSLSE